MSGTLSAGAVLTILPLAAITLGNLGASSSRHGAGPHPVRFRRQDGNTAVRTNPPMVSCVRIGEGARRVRTLRQSTDPGPCLHGEDVTDKCGRGEHGANWSPQPAPITREPLYLRVPDEAEKRARASRAPKRRGGGPGMMRNIRAEPSAADPVAAPTGPLPGGHQHLTKNTLPATAVLWPDRRSAASGRRM